MLNCSLVKVSDCPCAGTSAQVVAKEGGYVTLKLPSTEVRMVRRECYATVGQVGHVDARNVTLGKAGTQTLVGASPRGSWQCDEPSRSPSWWW